MCGPSNCVGPTGLILHSRRPGQQRQPPAALCGSAGGAASIDRQRKAVPGSLLPWGAAGMGLSVTEPRKGDCSTWVPGGDGKGLCPRALGVHALCGTGSHVPLLGPGSWQREWARAWQPPKACLPRPQGTVTEGTPAWSTGQAGCGSRVCPALRKAGQHTALLHGMCGRRGGDTSALQEPEPRSSPRTQARAAGSPPRRSGGASRRASRTTAGAPRGRWAAPGELQEGWAGRGRGGPADTRSPLQEARPQEDAAWLEAGGGGLGEHHGQRQHRHRGLLASPAPREDAEPEGRSRPGAPASTYRDSHRPALSMRSAVSEMQFHK